MTQPIDKPLLRKKICRWRRHLSAKEQHLAAKRLNKQLQSFLPLLKAQKVGTYWPHRGEISTLPYISQQKAQQAFFLPRIRPFLPASMAFGAWSGKQQWHRSELVPNQYGIPEPNSAKLQAWALDAVLVPLVAFDESGARMGMGGGFYDRWLGASNQHPKQPLKIGVAYEQQKSHDPLPREAWDQPMDVVITDQRIVVPAHFQG